MHQYRALKWAVDIAAMTDAGQIRWPMLWEAEHLAATRALAFGLSGLRTAARRTWASASSPATSCAGTCFVASRPSTDWCTSARRQSAGSVRWPTSPCQIDCSTG